jgi:hypothetical protein
MTVLNLVKKPDLAGCGPTHTCKLNELLVTVLDGRGDLTGLQIWSSYRAWLTTLAWGDTVGARTLLVITRTASMPSGDVATEVKPAYVTPDDEELAGLPDGVRPKPDSIVETASKFYWISAMALRGLLLQASIDNVREQLRRALEPATMS